MDLTAGRTRFCQETYNDCPTTVNFDQKLVDCVFLKCVYKEGGFTSYFGNRAFNDPIVPW